MIDLHIHLLPGVDDGAATLSEAVDMCRLAAEEGCDALVATPHQNPTWPNRDRRRLATLLLQLRRAVGEKPRIYPGAEIRAHPRIAEELATVGPADAEGPLPLAGGRWLLVELDRVGDRLDPEALVADLLAGGWRPILAHPELIESLAGDPRRVEALVAAGARTQLTAMSVTGEFGEGPRRVAWELLDRDLVHFLASDSHGLAYRPPGLSAARRIVARHWGEERGRRLTATHPRAVLDDRPLPDL